MRRLALLVGAGAAVCLAFLTAKDAETFLRAYLFAFLYWLSLPLGALGLLMTVNLTGGRWGDFTRGILEAMVRTTGGLALAVVPLLFGLYRHLLWPWANVGPGQSLSAHQGIYFNHAFFLIRALLYFACWIGLARGLTRESRDEAKVRVLSGGGLIAFGFAVTFASIDWQMSLEPLWYSTIYGMLFAIGQALQAWAFAIAVLTTVLPRHSIERPSDPTMRDIGNILLTLVILWAYLSFMQYLIIWSGNLPEEVKWILARTRGGWEILAILLASFQFAVPFSALLLRPAKQRAVILRTIAFWIIAARMVEQYWMIMPAFSPGSFQIHAADLAAWVTVGGFWLWLFIRRLDSRPLFPSYSSSSAPGEVAHVQA